jgi:hypothetical protein
VGVDRWCGSLTSGEGVLADGGFGGRGHISYPRAEHPLSHQGLLISGLYPTLRLLVPRMPGAPYPDKRLYPRGATGASHHRGGSISQGSEHRLEGHPFVAAYIEFRVQSLPRFCAHGLFRGHLDPNGRPGHPEHPIIGPPRSQGRVRAASTGAAFLHMHCSHFSDDAWWLAAFDRNLGPGCFVDECRLSFKLSETVTAARRVGCWAA